MSFFLFVIAALAVLFIIAFVAGYFRNRYYVKKIERGEIEAMPPVEIPDSECCGQHETCEKDSLLAAVSKDVEYYNDEELDRFRFRPSDSYSPEDVEEFQEVLYTMRNDEVAGWVRSLQLRSIELPDPVKDEVFLIIGERRYGS
jgi:hypothetical protein